MFKSNYRNVPGSIKDLSDRISEKKKLAQNFDWVKKKIDYYDIFSNYGNIFNENFVKTKTNYDIVNGKFNTEDLSYITNPFSLSGDLKFKFSALRNYNILSNIVNSLHGEEISKPYKPMAFTVNSDSISKKSMKRRDMIKDYVLQILDSYTDERLMQEAEKEGIDINSDEYQQFVETKMNLVRPPEVETYMSQGYKLPEEMQVQHIINYEKKRSNLKEKFDLGWLHSIISSKEIYSVGIEENKPFIRVVNPLFFNYGKSRDSDYIEDGHWASYVEYLTKTEIADRYSSQLTKDDWRQLDEIDTGIVSEDEQDWIYPVHHGMFNWDAYGDLDDPFAFFENGYIRVVHVVWKSLKKIKKVITIDPETNEPYITIVDETYVKNDEYDLSVEEMWVPEVWQGRKICTPEPIFVDMGPLPDQFRSMEDPYNVKLPYCGYHYSDLNSESISIAERGFVWQEIYNIVMYYFERALATDFGKIAFMNLHNMPDGITRGEFLHFMTQSKFGFLDMHKEGTNPNTDAQALKSMDMSNTSELSKYIEILTYIENKCMESMFYNRNRLGETGQYETVTNNQQNIVQSSHQTQPFFYQHNIVKENVTTLFIEQCRIAYRNNPQAIAYATDDNTVTSLVVDPELLKLSQFGVFIANDPNEWDKVNFLKNSMKEIIQNSNGDLRILGDIITMESPAQIKLQLYKFYEQQQKQQDQQRQHEQEMLKQQIESQQAQNEQQQQFEAQQKQLDRDNAIELANINSQMLALQHDIDLNKENDAIQKEKLKIEGSLQLEKEKQKSEKQENEKDRRLEREKEKNKLKIERIKQKNKSSK